MRTAFLPRRAFLQRTALLAAALGAGGFWRGCAGEALQEVAGLVRTGDLLVPEGVTARIVARSGERPVAGRPYVWHGAPDGGACFSAPDGGWVYVSNSELTGGQGGVGALRFAADGSLVDAYPVLRGTERNCAGGATPWGTWLSCEEVPRGRVWECDPLGQRAAEVRPALGRFTHEAAAADPVERRLYLTEDLPDGRLYRFTPAAWGDLSAGRLEVAAVEGGAPGPGDPPRAVTWSPVPDPSAAATPTRRQVAASTAFNGGEGIAWHAGRVVFSSKGDDRLWAYDTAAGTLRVLYDAATAPNPVLRGVDNVLIDDDGAVLVAEDGGDMQIVAVLPFGGPQPIVQVLGQALSEVTGLAFSPDRSRFYFSSQRGATGLSSGGITYELRGALPG